MYPFVYVFSLPCWGRPSGCIVPKPLGPDPVACIFLHLPKLIFPSLFNQPTVITYSIIASLGASTQARRWCMGPSLPRPTNLSGCALAHGTRHARHLTRPSVPSLHPDQPAAGRRQKRQTMFLLMPVHRNLAGRIAGGTASLLSSSATRLRVKRGAPEYRDSGALTSSPALTPWP